MAVRLDDFVIQHGTMTLMDNWELEDAALEMLAMFKLGGVDWEVRDPFWAPGKGWFTELVSKRVLQIQQGSDTPLAVANRVATDPANNIVLNDERVFQAPTVHIDMSHSQTNIKSINHRIMKRNK